MAAATFMHISFNFEGRPSKDKELKMIFDLAIDWVRYAPNCWIVYTTSTPKAWYERLKPKLHPNDSVFICELDMKNHYGSMHKFVWDWIGKKR